MKLGWTAALAALLLAGAAQAQQQIQVQTQPVQAQAQASQGGITCLALSSHTYVVELQGPQTNIIAWMRFQPDGNANGTAMASNGAPARFDMRCTASPGWSDASPMRVLVMNATQGSPIPNGAFSILIADNGARFALVNQGSGPVMSGWGVRQH